MSKYILCVAYIFFSVSGLVIIKIGANATEARGITIPMINLHLSTISILGIMCYGISFCIYMGVVANFSIGFIVPLLGGIVNILILVASAFVLQEGLETKSIIGALIVIIGIVVMNI